MVFSANLRRLATKSPEQTKLLLSVEELFARLEGATQDLAKTFSALPPLPETIDPRVTQDLGQLNDLLAHAPAYLASAKEALLAQEVERKAAFSKAQHTLGAHIAAIQGYVDFVLEGLNPPQQDPTFQERMRHMAHTASEALGMISRLPLPGDPAPDAPCVALEESASVYDSYHSGSRALVIDASPYNREILERRLQQYGLTVLTAETALKGLQMAAENEIDLILLNIGMPDLKGAQVIERLKDSLKTRNIPILVTSAVHDSASILQCIQTGAEDYLSVPFNLTLLNARMRACLERKRSRDNARAHELSLRAMTQAGQALIEALDIPAAVLSDQRQVTLYNTPFAAFYQRAAQENLLPTHEVGLRKMRAGNSFLLPGTHNAAPLILDASWLPQEDKTIQMQDGTRFCLQLRPTPQGVLVLRIVPLPTQGQ